MILTESGLWTRPSVSMLEYDLLDGLYRSEKNSLRSMASLKRYQSLFYTPTCLNVPQNDVFPVLALKATSKLDTTQVYQKQSVVVFAL